MHFETFLRSRGKKSPPNLLNVCVRMAPLKPTFSEDRVVENLRQRPGGTIKPVNSLLAAGLGKLLQRAFIDCG